MTTAFLFFQVYIGARLGCKNPLMLYVKASHEDTGRLGYDHWRRGKHETAGEYEGKYETAGGMYGQVCLGTSCTMSVSLGWGVVADNLFARYTV